MTHKFERVRQNHDDLFGSDEEEEENLGGGGGGSDNERSAGGDYEDNGYPPYTQGEEEQRQYWMNAELTQDKRPYPVDGEYILVRWPNSLTLEARRFDPAKYIDLLAEDHDPAKFKSRGNKVPLDRIHQAYDSIRSAVLWRSVGNNSEKVPAMESNSRLVKWSDGSMTLLTGGGAHYDIKAETLSTPTAAGEDRHQ
ncbi:Paf1 complex component, partial [Spiromyces aspiralis]